MMEISWPGMSAPSASRLPLTTYEPITVPVPGSTRSAGPKSLASKWSSPSTVMVNVLPASAFDMSAMLQFK